MRNILVGLLILLLVGVGIYFVRSWESLFTSSSESPKTGTTSSSFGKMDTSEAQVIAQGLDTPWAAAFLPASPDEKASRGGPDKSMLVTERAGRVRFIDSNRVLDPNPVAEISEVREIGEGGLLGITLHPNFSSNNFLYLYYTYEGSGDDTLNRVVRYAYKDKKLSDETIIVDKIPGASNHNGGRIKFGPDGLLYIGTGDAQKPSQAQDTKTLGGKILRVTDEGKVPAGNPFGNAVYSYGHRNVQGLAWNDNGDLWATEHGRSGVQSGLDELNLIQAGKNYGWPEIQGNETRDGMETPRRNSGSTTWAPSGATFLPAGRQGVDNSLFFSGLRGTALYEAVIENGQVKEVREHLKGQFGRIREVVAGQDGMIYISTSNRDGRGNPDSADDRIIRVNPAKL